VTADGKGYLGDVFSWSGAPGVAESSAGTSCSDWTDGQGAPTFGGLAGKTSSEWFAAVLTACTEKDYHLYCFQE
jgi:hypothetical protein